MHYIQRIESIIVSLLAVFIIIFSANSLKAADVTLVKEYTYQASEADSKLSSRAIALEQIKRLLLEELGTFLISETEVKDFQLTKDQIVTYTAGSVITVILQEKWDGQNYYMKARLTANPLDVAKSIADLRQDKEKSLELEELRKKSNESLREIEKLKQVLALSKNDKKGKEAYEVAVSQLQIKEFIDKGIVLRKEKKYDDAIEILTQAIALQPKEARAYLGRGVVYGVLKKLERALNDFNKAIELNPKYAAAYNNRGIAYKEQKEFDRAIVDHTKAIELDPKYAAAYNNRGVALALQKEFNRAISDYTKAIELDPKYAVAYNNRGLALGQQKEFDRTISDCTKAIELDPKYAVAYNTRGNAYFRIQEYERAIADFTKALEIDPNNALAYNNRGIAYNRIKEVNRSIEDYKKAAQLGHKAAQDLLRKRGLNW